MSRELIAFYSRADENYWNGTLKTLRVGNTETAAQIIAGITGGELFHIEQLQPYSKDYNECTNEAKADRERGARPELRAYPENMNAYDVIYLGYPNYWGTMPMAVFTFLEKFDFSGKTIKPFCTHEGSGFGESISDIERLCPGAKVEKGLAIRGCRVNEARHEIENWI